MHSAALYWTEYPNGDQRHLAFRMERWENPVELAGDTVEVVYLKPEPAVVE